MVGSRLATKGIDDKWPVFISVSAISPGEWTEGRPLAGRYCARYFNLEFAVIAALDLKIQRFFGYSTNKSELQSVVE